MLSGQSTDQTMRVLEGAAVCTLLSPVCTFGLYPGAMHTRDMHVKRAFLYDIVPSLGDAISQGRRIRDRYHDIESL